MILYTKPGVIALLDFDFLGDFRRFSRRFSQKSRIFFFFKWSLYINYKILYDENVDINCWTYPTFFPNKMFYVNIPVLSNNPDTIYYIDLHNMHYAIFFTIFFWGGLVYEHFHRKTRGISATSKFDWISELLRTIVNQSLQHCFAKKQENWLSLVVCVCVCVCVCMCVCVFVCVWRCVHACVVYIVFITTRRNSNPMNDDPAIFNVC